MKISILNFDLSNNSLGRAYILAKILSRKYEIEILGPAFEDKIWAPLAEDRTIKIKILSKSLKSVKANLAQIDGEIIYAIKPYGTSYGYALLKKLFNGKKVILDEDDWDLGFFLDMPKKIILNNVLDIFNINNVFYIYLFSKLSFLADKVTVSSTFLQKKFGGTIIPHARDSEMFNVNNHEVNGLIKKYNPEKKKIIMFFGTIRQHKGIDIIVNAIDLLKRNDILFLLVGVDASSKTLIPDKNYIKIIPPQKFTDLAIFLSMADLIVLPQKKSYSTLGQVPAKIFDAMALGKPIIGSNVSDIPLILDGCGLVFEPDDYKELSIKIGYILDNPKKAEELGKKAKQKFLQNYSFDAVENKLFSIFNKL